MMEIIIFSFGIMYTPGPVNLLSLNNGLQNRMASQIPFSLGVGLGLFIWFMAIGYVGTSVVQGKILPYMGILGAGFILYLGYKVITAKVDVTGSGSQTNVLSFRTGLLMQSLNPKNFMVVLPVTTVLFPAAGITGTQIAIWAAILAFMGFGAPIAYALVGSLLGRRVTSPNLFRFFNIIMGFLLVFVALEMLYEQVYLPLCN